MGIPTKIYPLYILAASEFCSTVVCFFSPFSTMKLCNSFTGELFYLFSQLEYLL
ncbi:hypothetical protein AX774_g5814, partial [Zancudomyces culisetae]